MALPGEQIITVNDVELCVETFGDRADPAVLLLHGAGNSMLSWDEELCRRLSADRFVIRYDSRDAGRSTTYEPGASPYTLRDLGTDAVGVLDTLGVDRAHLVGMSMGGAVSQLVALDHPSRVASLTLIATPPGGPGHEYPDLPAMSEQLQAFFADEPPEPDWSDRTAVIDYLVDAERPFAGPRPFDEAGLRALTERVVDRADNIAAGIADNIAAGMANHFMIDAGQPWRDRLGQISAPTLVLHGTEDPLFPYGNAVALSAEIPGSTLLPLQDMGHEAPPRETWDVVVPAVLQHTSTPDS